jgi:general nucleoside transport system ATP-binding protein
VLMLGDRIGVMSNGRLLGVVPRTEVDITQIGLIMAGSSSEVSTLS